MRCWRRPTFFRYFFQSSVGQSSVRFSTSAIRLSLRHGLYFPVCRACVSVSRSLHRAFASQAILLGHGLRLAACSARAENRDRLPRSEHPLFVTVGWHFTPGFLAGGVRLRGGGLTAKPLPFWACLSAVGQGLHDDASDVSSLALPVVTCSARRLVRLKPCRLFLHALRCLIASRPPLDASRAVT